MNKNNKKLVFEDLVQHQNKWTGAHQMTQRKQPEQLTIMDILAQDRANSKKNAQHPNNVTSPAPEIAGEAPLLQLMGDMMIQNEEIKKVIRTVHTSPVLEDNTRAKAKLNAIMNKLVAIDNIIKKAADDIDQFKVEVVDV
tara:strand:- start:385 stop:804 length:420 start_codon:yes stop_codon:yes gene_type:complete